MFDSLRGRLLVSYALIILVALVVVAVALFGFATLTAVRDLPVLQRLASISLTNLYELRRLQELGADAALYEQFLTQTAEYHNVRILVASSTTRRVIYDSEEENSWLGVFIEEVNQPRRLSFDVERNTVYGRFRHPNGTFWLVYSQPVQFFNRALIFYAQQEPTALEFFRDSFLQPLVWAGVVAFLLSILLAAWIARSVARPLQQLATATEAVAQGEYDQRLPLAGPQEVKRVAASFNSMSEQVQAGQKSQQDFLANVSHDLRTPITSVSGWSQALLDGTAASTAERHQAAGVIHDEAERMQRLVDELLDLARIESGQLVLALEIVDIGLLLANVYQAFLPRAEASGLTMILDAQPGPAVKGDPDRLTQVFSNLIENALIYTPMGGQIRLSSAPGSNREVVVAVQDNGPGIPAAEQGRIFERFYRVDKSRAHDGLTRGSGLGLAIAQELVEAHQGRIELQSREGQGSTFFVYLPLA
jgi:signal transduction histidine kinase